MNCQHWSDCGIVGAGRCGLGLFGGEPSLGVCAMLCTRRVPIRPDEPVIVQRQPDTAGLSADVQALVGAELRGLGDDIEVLAKAMGADRLAKAFEELTGWSCGCPQRKALLNKLPSIGRIFGWIIGG